MQTLRLYKFAILMASLFFSLIRQVINVTWKGKAIVWTLKQKYNQSYHRDNITDISSPP